MEKEILNKYLNAGRIAAQALQYGRGLIKEGNKIVDIVEAVERKIESLGGKPAFPVNISLNDVAAHYSPFLDDMTIVKSGDYVKLDVGVHVEGWIADTAITVRLAGEDEMIKCANKMLATALPMFRPGTSLTEIGEAIENVAKEFKLNPVRNLTGHSLDRYNLHAGFIVPNVRISSTKTLVEDEVYAVEPFCTSGGGWVKDAEPPMIFRWLADKPVRFPEARKIIELGKTNFSKLPFAKRWLQHQMTAMKLEVGLKQAITSGALHAYNILKESSGAPVAQAEHTVIVADKPIVITRL
ncbi:MAG: type II methionyl aminopeptidase [Candidatus Aenigmatarchaeota archaeon]|nr:type II methionyl aminopeptidase [Candidatus Aenigmarchaeota archaeon]